MTYLPSKKINPQTENLLGQRFSRWEVISFSHKDNTGHTYWTVRCDCGQTKIVRGTDLKNGGTKSCGCLARELKAKSKTIHGYYCHPLYVCWRNKISCCYNPNRADYGYYGGRGITVYEPWRFGEDGKSGVECFIRYVEEHLGAKPSPKHTIDRIDNDGNYEPGNLRWATKKQQTDNRRQPIWTNEARARQGMLMKIQMTPDRRAKHSIRMKRQPRSSNGRRFSKAA